MFFSLLLSLYLITVILSKTE